MFTLGDGAGWSSPVARQAHNLKVAGSNPAPATTIFQQALGLRSERFSFNWFSRCQRFVQRSGIVPEWRGGAGCRDRTRDPLITNQVLYQLS